MDIYMPEMDGYDATRYIRNTMKIDIPIIALSANISEIYKKKCLELGMNDYVSKPFKIEELLRVINRYYKKEDLVYEKNSPEAIDRKTDVIVNNIVNGFISKINLSPEPFAPRQRKQFTMKLSKPMFMIKNKSESYSIPNFSNSFFKQISRSSSFYCVGGRETFDRESLDTINLNSLKDLSGNDEAFQNELLSTFIQEVPGYFQELEFDILRENFDAIKKTAHKLKSRLGIFGLNILKKKLEKIEEFCEKSEIIPIVKLVGFCKNNLEIITRDFKSSTIIQKEFIEV